jgi:hypothetical protein
VIAVTFSGTCHSPEPVRTTRSSKYSADSGCGGVKPTSASMLLFSVALIVVSRDWIHAETIFLSYG